MIHHAPIQISVKLQLTDGSGTNAEVSWDMPPGRYPTPEEIEAGNQRALAQAQEAMPSLRPMTKREWWEALCAERFGARYALPGAEEWDKP